MKRLKKSLALFISVIMLSSIFSACGSDNTENISSSNSGSTSAEALKNLTAQAGAFTKNEKGYPDLKGATFKVWQRNYRTDFCNDYGQFESIKELQKLFNMKLEFIHPPVGQESENFSIMMASNKLPDLIFSGGVDEFYSGGLNAAYNDGILYDYTKEINETNTPNFLKAANNNEYLKKIISDDKGRIVRLGAKIQGSEASNFQFNGLLIRDDMLKTTGMAVPETIDEWHQLLTTFKKNGIETPYGASQGNALWGFAYAWNLNPDAANGFTVDEKGKIVYGPAAPEYKDYINTMHQWFSEGLINSDYMNTEDKDLQAMISNDRVGSTNMHLWNYQNGYYTTTEENNPAKSLVPAQFPVLKKGDPLPRIRSNSRNVDDYKYITADAKDPMACIYLLDALYLPEISTMLEMGMENVGWKKDGDKAVQLIISNDAPVETKLKGAATQWHMYEDTDADLMLAKKYFSGNVPNALNLWKKCSTDGYLNTRYLYLTDDESKTISKIKADISTYVNEMSLKFITGTEPMGNFNAYTDSLKSMGVDDYISVYQAAYDRYLARK